LIDYAVFKGNYGFIALDNFVADMADMILEKTFDRENAIFSQRRRVRREELIKYP